MVHSALSIGLSERDDLVGKLNKLIELYTMCDKNDTKLEALCAEDFFLTMRLVEYLTEDENTKHETTLLLQALIGLGQLRGDALDFMNACHPLITYVAEQIVLLERQAGDVDLQLLYMALLMDVLSVEVQMEDDELEVFSREFVTVLFDMCDRDTHSDATVDAATCCLIHLHAQIRDRVLEVLRTHINGRKIGSTFLSLFNHSTLLSARMSLIFLLGALEKGYCDDLFASEDVHLMLDIILRQLHDLPENDRLRVNYVCALKSWMSNTCFKDDGYRWRDIYQYLFLLSEGRHEDEKARTMASHILYEYADMWERLDAQEERRGGTRK